MKKDSYRCIREYVKKDGSITYHAEVRRHPAKPIRQKFRNLTLAKNWVRETESDILNSKQPIDNKTRKLTLNDLIDQHIRLNLNKHPGRLKDQTPHLNWWRKQYGTRALMNITSGLLAEAREELLNGMTSRKLPRTNSTVNRYFSSLSRAFSLAHQEWQWIAENPFRRVTKLKENKGRNRFLNRDELNRFLECCKQSRNPYLHGMVLIASSMALRFGEIVNVRWKHIQNGFITLETTKNGDSRSIPIPSSVASYLEALDRPKTLQDYLFPAKNPERRHPPSMIRKAFDKALRDAQIEDFTFHDLRHTCASHLAMNGATQAELMEILGHRSPTMTKRYAHFTKEHIARVLQKTSNSLIGNPGENNNGPH